MPQVGNGELAWKLLQNLFSVILNEVKDLILCTRQVLKWLVGTLAGENTAEGGQSPVRCF